MIKNHEELERKLVSELEPIEFRLQEAKTLITEALAQVADNVDELKEFLSKDDFATLKENSARVTLTLATALRSVRWGLDGWTDLHKAIELEPADKEAGR